MFYFYISFLSGCQRFRRMPGAAVSLDSYPHIHLFLFSFFFLFFFFASVIVSRLPDAGQKL